MLGHNKLCFINDEVSFYLAVPAQHRAVEGQHEDETKKETDEKVVEKGKERDTADDTEEVEKMVGEEPLILQGYQLFCDTPPTQCFFF